MQTHKNKQSGGEPAAFPGTNLEPVSSDAFRAPSYPQAASPTLTDQPTAITDQTSNEFDEEVDYTQDEVDQKYNPTSCRTPQDFERRESYNVLKMDAVPCFRVYPISEYGSLRTTMIDGEAWCSLEDTARIAGVATYLIIGCPTEGNFPVRGAPGHLIPDGVRDLTAQGIPDTGIRLEALVPHFEDARGGTYLSECLEAVLKDAYTGLIEGKYANGSSTRVVGPKRMPAEGIKLWQYRYYERGLGELRVVVVGASVWCNVTDVSRCTPLGIETINQIAGESRVTRIDNTDLANADEPQGSADYVLLDAAIKLFYAIEDGEFIAQDLEQWIAKEPQIAWVMSLASEPSDMDPDCWV